MSDAGAIFGLTLANDITFPDHGIVVASGSARSIEDGADMVLATSKLKRLNFAWSTGTGALDTGSIAANTGYHVFVIYNPTTADTNILVSTSATNPLMPSGYTSKRRIRALLTDANSVIRPAIWTGGWCRLKTPFSMGFGDFSGAATLKTTGVPLGVKLQAEMLIATTSSSAGYVVVSDPDLGAPSLTLQASFYQPANVLTGQTIREWTNTSGQVYAGAQSANAITSNTLLKGWYDACDTSV